MFLKIQKRNKGEFKEWMVLEIKFLSWVKEDISNMSMSLPEVEKQLNLRVPFGELDLIDDKLINGNCYKITAVNLHDNCAHIIWAQEFYIMNDKGQTVDYYKL